MTVLEKRDGVPSIAAPASGYSMHCSKPAVSAPRKSRCELGAERCWASSALVSPAIASTSRLAVLSYANRRRLEIARAMATSPKLILLDEPVAGMNPVESAELTPAHPASSATRWATPSCSSSTTMSVVRDISDRVVVLDHGGGHRPGHLHRGISQPAGDRGLSGPIGRGGVEQSMSPDTPDTNSTTSSPACIRPI